LWYYWQKNAEDINNQSKIPSLVIILSQMLTLFLIRKSFIEYEEVSRRPITKLYPFINKILIIFLIIVFLSSCYSYYRNIKKEGHKIEAGIGGLLVLFAGFLIVIVINVYPLSIQNSSLLQKGVNWVRKRAKFKDPKDETAVLRSFLGILQGILAVYIFTLGSKLSKKISNEFLQTLRSTMGAMTFFLAILSLSSLIIAGSPESIYWTIRISIWLFPSLIGILAISAGFIYGNKDEPLAKYIGTMLTFIIALVIGVMITPFIEKGNLIFSSTIAFSYNCTLLIGFLAHLVGNNRPIANFVKEKL